LTNFSKEKKLGGKKVGGEVGSSFKCLIRRRYVDYV